MKKRWWIVLIIVILLVVGFLIWSGYEKRECKKEYENCMSDKEAGMKVVCFPCE